MKSYNHTGQFTHVEESGYTFEEFQKKTSGSLRNLFYGENQTFLEYDRFQRLQGCGEGQMLMSDGTPVFVRMCKERCHSR